MQGYLNGVGESINVNTDQDAAQTWQTTVSGNSTLSLMIELSGAAATNSIGLYNAGNPAPPLYQVFPGAAAAGWFAVASFQTAPTRVVVNLFDNFANLMGVTTYLGADASNFGYYLQGASGGVYYTQDARNPGGLAQALTYAGTGNNAGQWWLCWDDAASSDRDFDDAVLFLESIAPTPVGKTTWGALKRRFR